MADQDRPASAGSRHQPPTAAGPRAADATGSGTASVAAIETGWVLVLLAVAAMSVNAGVSALVLDAGVTPEALTAIRTAGTAVVLGGVLVVSGNARRLAVARGEWPWLVVYGVGGVALVQWAYFVAIDRIPIGLALLLEYLAPLIVALVTRFVLRRIVSALVWPALALTLGGLALATRVPGGGLDPWGVVAGLTAAGAFATYFMVGERLVARRDPVSTTFWGFAIAATVATAIAAPALPETVRLATDASPLPVGPAGATLPVAVLMASVALLGTLLPFTALTAAMRTLPAALVTIAGTAEVVGAAAVAWWWFDQTLTAVQVTGFALVLAGVVLALLSRRPPSEPAPPPALDAPGS